MKTLQSILNSTQKFDQHSPLLSDDDLRGIVTSVDAGGSSSDSGTSPQSSNQSRFLSSTSPNRNRYFVITSALAVICTSAAVWISSTNDTAFDLSTNREVSAVSNEFPTNSTSRQSLRNEAVTTVPLSQSNSLNSLVIPENIKGITCLELTDEELSAIGVRRNGDSYSVTSKLGIDFRSNNVMSLFKGSSSADARGLSYNPSKAKKALARFADTLQPTSSVYFAVTLDSFALRSKAIARAELKNSTPANYPLMISLSSQDYRSEHDDVLLFGSEDDSKQIDATREELTALLYGRDIDDKAIAFDPSRFPLVSKLIPIRIRQAKSETYFSDIVLWYPLTESLISALPPRYQSALRREDERVNDVEQNGEGSEINQRYAGEYQFTEIARATSGAISISSIYPNPARDNSTITVSSKEQRSVVIVIYDFMGKKLLQFGEAREITAGSFSEVSLDLTSLPSGAYLITAISDQREQAIQRLIIQH